MPTACGTTARCAASMHSIFAQSYDLVAKRPRWPYDSASMEHLDAARLVVG